jgi:hypothetical protein
MKRIVLIVVLVLVLAASVVAGLLDLWPNLHRSDTTADRHEKVRIASIATRELGNSNWYVYSVRLNYLPHRALVQWKAYSTGRSDCMVVSQDFGDRFDGEDFDRAPCDL